jgi:hypothetical protein
MEAWDKFNRWMRVVSVEELTLDPLWTSRLMGAGGVL